ncbi:type II secretion system F family protein [Actimicrobium sp. CCI2.3]|uniref:type II secretion system F family protein n=1 Tax=Actimicrobium sp. CCI2.3 TaxID=3048616 RepID=UPI002AB3F592|nr:type II secretion system F family protein [Actimicrobium sp. CCI2.3]MDY7572930.1 type II secretion system F family protein [Actimicrobium sp. CCI2.3]MEB0020775.1 type II secretion system F family protein [Actimicrobium sp. CCI2.3]
MALYAYKARHANGMLEEGTLDADDGNAVASLLFGMKLTPIDIVRTSRVRGQHAPGLWARLRRPAISTMDVQLFSRQFHTLLKAGVPIMRSLAGLEESAINPSFARVLVDIRESLDAGRELSFAMRRHPDVFSVFYTSMVRVGEMTGRLDEIFLRLFDHLEFERDMKQRVTAAMRYPSFVVTAIIVAIGVIDLFVIPAFSKVYAGFHAELPLMTRLLITSSDWVIHYWPFMLAIMAIAGAGLRAVLRTSAGLLQWDRFKLRIPLIGTITRKSALARFARSFAMSSQSGVPIVAGLKVVAHTVDNTYIARRVEKMRESVERGESIYRAAAAASVFTPIVLQMISVGEETGELDKLMNEIADMYEREVSYELKTLSAKIEPILIVALGGLVLILALGIFLPIWDLGNVAMKK